MKRRPPYTGETLFYPNAIRIIRTKILMDFPRASANEIRDDEHLEDYILWMLEQIEKMPSESIESATKAGRWLGWILCIVEEKLKLWTNEQSRNITRMDVRIGFDIPSSHS